MKSTPTYDRIRSLADALQHETGIKKRREVGKGLLHTLSNDDVRRKLGQEATPVRCTENDLSIAASRCHALSKLWTIIILRSIAAAKSISSSGKAKTHVDDITLPYYLFIQCDKADDAFDNSGLDIPKISGKTVRNLVNYSLTMLGNEEADEIAGPELLRMMNLVCSRPRYVGYFKPGKTIDDILSEIVEERLSKPDFESQDPDRYILCAKVLDSLFKTCRTLEIQLAQYARQIIELTSGWCKTKLQRSQVTAQSDIMLHFFNVTSTVMECHPDHAVTLIQRHGRAFLSYIKRCYGQTNGISKHALNRYLLAHIHVARVAGAQQGFTSNDFGDLAKASLNATNIAIFLKLVVADTSKVVLTSKPSNESAMIRRSRSMNKYIWVPMDQRQRCHLELSAILLQYAQRLFVVDSESVSKDHATEKLEKCLDAVGTPASLPASSLSLEEQIRSPWVEIVLKDLYSHAVIGNAADAKPTSGNTNASFSQRSYAESARDISETLEGHPLIEFFSGQTLQSKYGPLTLLPLITACAEVFPSGACWTTTTQGRWVMPQGKDGTKHDPQYHSFGGPQDLAMLLYLLAQLMASKGVSTSDRDIQAWILVTLAHLAKSSRILASMRSTTDDQHALDCLRSSWVLVWQTTLRSDLRYSSYTANPTKDSLGDLVIMLLTEIIQHGCIEPPLASRTELGNTNSGSITPCVSWLFDRQDQVWMLPVFSSSHQSTSTSSLELICAILNTIGLSDQGADTIDATFELELNDISTTHQLTPVGRTNRRRRLVLYLLGRLHNILSNSRYESMEKYLATLSGTMLMLISGVSTTQRSSFFTRTMPVDTASSRSLFAPPKCKHFGCRFTPDQPPAVSMASGADADSSTTFDVLWFPEDVSTINLQLSAHRSIVPEIGSASLSPPAKVEDSSHAHFIPHVEADFLLRVVLEYLEYQSKPIFERNGEDAQSDNESMLSGSDSPLGSLQTRFAIFKVVLTLSLCGRDEVFHQEIDSVKGEISYFLREATTLISSGRAIGADLISILKNLWGLISVSARLPPHAIDFFRAELEELNTQCQHLLNQYRESRRDPRTVADASRSSSRASRKTKDMDFTDESDQSDGSDMDEGNAYGHGGALDDPTSPSAFHGRSGRPQKRKRTSAGMDERHLRRRVSTNGASENVMAHNKTGAKYAALILLGIQPSVQASVFVCERLLCHDIDTDPDSVSGDVDASMALFCAHTLSNWKIAHNRSTWENESELSLPIVVCRVVELLWAGAGPASTAYQHSITFCARALSLANEADRVEAEDVKSVIDILTSLEADDERYGLRLAEIQTAGDAFVGGGELFAKQFGGTFFGDTLKPNISDICSSVRRQASASVGLVMRTLHSDPKRLEGILKYAAPVLKSTQSKDREDAVKQWYESVRTNADAEDIAVLKSILADSHNAFEHDSVTLRSIVAGCTNSPETSNAILLELVELASSRLEMNGLCFHACERIAGLRGYAGIEMLMESEGEGVLMQWIKKGERLVHLPLLLTAPALLRRSLERLVYVGTKATTDDDKFQQDFLHLSRRSADRFIVQMAHVAVPAVLSHLVMAHPSTSNAATHTDANENENANTSPATSAGTSESLLQSDLVQDLVSVLVPEERGDGTMGPRKQLLELHIHDILAHCISLSRAEDDHSKLVALRLTAMVEDQLGKDSIPVYEKEHSSLIVRRILELCSKAGTYGHMGIKFGDVLSNFVLKINPSATKRGDIFLASGTSITENLIQANHWLRRSNNSEHTTHRWRAVQLICDLVISQMQEQNFKGIQLGYIIHRLLMIALETQHSSMQLTVLKTLHQLLAEAEKAIEDTEVCLDLTNSLQKLACATYCIHRRAQKLYLDFCMEKKVRQQRILRASANLLTNEAKEQENSADPWGWDQETEITRASSITAALEEFGATADPAIIDVMCSTYDILELTTKCAELVDADNDVFICAAPPQATTQAEIEALSGTQAKFCAQLLVEEFVNQRGCDGEVWVSNPKDLVVTILNAMNGGRYYAKASHSDCASRHRARSAQKTKAHEPVTTSMEEEILNAQLRQLRVILHSQRSKGSTIRDFGLQQDQYEKLFRCLSRLCGKRHPHQLREVASQCLAEFDLQELSESSLVMPTISKDWIDRALTSNSVTSALAEKVLFVLCDCIHSAHAQICLIASRTLQALLSTRQGKKIWDQIRDKHIRRTLEPFRGSSKKMSACSGDAGAATSEVSQNSDGNASDCWRSDYWRCSGGGELDFDRWICKLVTALISSLFSPDTSSSKPTAEMAFFVECHAICAVEPSAAKAMFPCIVLNLLERKGLKINVRKCLTEAFKTVLAGEIVEHTSITASHPNTNMNMNTKNSSGTNDHAVGLALDTLFLLRRVTQYAFLASARHRRNPMSIPNRSYGDAKNKKKVNFNKDLGPDVVWNGVPYGIVLGLDGLLVAESCVRVHRYASAIFYIEMYMDSSLGFSGGVMEFLSTSFVNQAGSPFFKSSEDISGFAAKTQRKTKDMIPIDEVTRTALKMIPILERCFRELGDPEALKALQVQKASLSFQETSTSVFKHAASVSASLTGLKRLDDQFNLASDSNTRSMGMAKTLDALGLHGLQQVYIEGMSTRSTFVDRVTATERTVLREKWFESKLHLMEWEKLKEEQHEQSHSGMANLRCPIPIGTNRTGFFETLVDAQTAFAENNVATCLSALGDCRQCILDGLQSDGEDEKPLGSLFSDADKLQSIADFEHLVTHEDELGTIFTLWGVDETQRDAPFSSSTQADLSKIVETTHKFTLSPHSANLRENLLRTMLSRYHRNISEHNPEAELVEHLWAVCTNARTNGATSLAETMLERLAPLLSKSQFDSSAMDVDTVLGHGSPAGGTAAAGSTMALQTTFLLRMEEARVLESRGEFGTATRQMQQVINFLQNSAGSLESDLEAGNDAMHTILADAQILCGCWLKTYKVDQAKDILHRYLQPGASVAMSLYEADANSRNAERVTNAFLALAEVAASLYDDVNDRTNSSEWMKTGSDISTQYSELKECLPMMEAMQEKYKKLKARGASTTAIETEYRELEIYFHTTKRELDRASAERKAIEKSVGSHLKVAVESFIAALSYSDTSTREDMSKHVFRLISLWFSASENITTADQGIDSVMADGCERIPSFRFVTLTNQLFSRIESIGDGSKDGFQPVLQSFVTKMCSDHPYHCLTHLVALANGKNVGSGVSGRNVKDYLENVGDSKINAATDLLQHLKKEGSAFVGGLVDSHKTLCNAYIHLAHAPTDAFHKTKTKDIPFAKVCASSNINLSLCLGTPRRQKFEFPPCIMTSPPPVQPSADYGDGTDDPIGGERIHGFNSTFSVTETGLHRPKIVTCIGSKANSYRQLVKGEDEIRQDAVMSQVFEFVNNLMNRHTRTSPTDGQAKAPVQSGFAMPRKRLRLVTYNIIPLSPASGVLEWVEDTMAFGEYMMDKRSRGSDGKVYYKPAAHSKYYPGEWGNTLCRLHMTHSPPNEKRESFDAVCKHHSPVFRFFFVERFGHSMQAWHAAKREYTRSVAVNSIVGHILGIGDRHTSNILVHQKTGEVVHIDFGIVFDQGKLLNIPEKIPFRLTRNVIDGMGPCGTEGTFNVAAQETALVLRENANALLTILSAIVADPLYKWSVSPVKARTMQMANDKDADDDIDGSDKARVMKDVGKKNSKNAAAAQTKEDHNKAASQAITKIHEKLQGYEDGTSGEQQSIEGQVQLLINSARDPDNLSTLFPGWAPWI